MSYTKFTKRDRNRFKKIYPFVKRTPRWAYWSPVNFQMEIGELEFDGESYQSFLFDSNKFWNDSFHANATISAIAEHAKIIIEEPVFISILTWCINKFLVIVISILDHIIIF